MPRLTRIALVLCVAVCAAPSPVPRGNRGAPADPATPTPAAPAPRDPVAVAPEPRPFALLARFGAPADGKVLTTADRFEFSADGRRMLAVGGGTVEMWNLTNGKPLWSAAGGYSGRMAGPMRIGLSPDGRWVLTSSGFDMRTVVRDAETGQVRSDKQWSEDKLLAGLDGPQRVWVRNHTTGDLVSHALPNGPPVRTISTPAKYAGFFTSSDGRWIVAGTMEAVFLRDALAANGQWVEIESQRDVPRRFCGHSAPAGTIPLQFSPCGRYLLTWRRGLHLWHAAEKSPRSVRLTTVPDDTWEWPDGSFARDGRRLAAVVTEKGTPGSVRVWETATGSEAFRFDPPGGATGCALTPDGRRLVVAHPDATFSVWDYRALEARAVGPAGGWESLASRDAKAGLAAVHALAADPAAVARLRDLFRPENPTRMARLIAELGDDDYPTRETAERALAALGERAEAGLHRAAVGSDSPEVRRRAACLLGPLAGPHGATRLRVERAVEALERLGTPAAAELLAEWAKDGPPRLAAAAVAAAVRLGSGACTRGADSEQ